MSFSGSGTFLINTAGQPVVSGTVISSTAFNALTADLATGLSTCITKDGQTTVTANIPMATYKFTGLGAGSAAADSANLSQVQSTVVKLLASVSGTDTITAVGSPTVAAYAAGQMFYFVAAGDNTGAVTLNIDSLGAKAVTRDGSVALAASDIKSGEVVVVVYDGTRFQVVSQLNSSGDARFANVSIASSLYVGGVATIVGNAGFSANVSITSALSVGATATITGTVTGSKFIPTGNVTTGNGMYLPTTNQLAFSTNGTEAVRVDASQNVGIGTSSPATMLNLGGATDKTIRIDSSTSNAGYFGVYQNQTIVSANRNPSTGSFTDTAKAASYIVANAAAGNGFIQFATTASNNTEPTEYMRLTAAGNLGVGTTSPTYRFTVVGATSDATPVANFRGYATGNDGDRTAILRFTSSTDLNWAVARYDAWSHIWHTNGSERARITSGGDWLVGTTTTTDASVISKDASNKWIFSLYNTNSSLPNGLIINYSAAAPNNTAREFLYCSDNAALRASIRSNGGLANYQANDANLSDERVKTDIKPVGSYWNKIKAIEIVTFKYKDQTHDDDNVGVIAQQVESVAPEFVDVDGWSKEPPEDGVPLKSIYTTDMYHAAIKALQETMGRIEALEAKVAALEAK